MSAVEIVAATYGRPIADVQLWPAGVIAAFHRNAIARGYLLAAA